MTVITKLGKEILATLRRDGPLDMFQLAGSIGDAPFRIRGELQALRRHRLVYFTLERDRVSWMLTNRGYECAHISQQTTLTEGKLI